MKDWKHESLRLKAKHQWKSKPGYKIIVLDKGAVRFDYPETWVVKMEDDGLKIYDGEPPVDDVRLGISYRRLPPMNPKDFPLEKFLRDTVETDERNPVAKGEMQRITRIDWRGAWQEIEFVDLAENRPAFSRIFLAVGGGVWCLMTLEFWAEDRERIDPVWTEVLRSLRLGHYIADPTTGIAANPSLN